MAERALPEKPHPKITSASIANPLTEAIARHNSASAPITTSASARTRNRSASPPAKVSRIAEATVPSV